MIPWDPSDDLPTPQLLQTAGWGTELVSRCATAYDELLAQPSGTLESRVVTLLERLGVQPTRLARRCQRAIFRRAPTVIAFEELLIGLVALDPTTAHGGGTPPQGARPTRTRALHALARTDVARVHSRASRSLERPARAVHIPLL